MVVRLVCQTLFPFSELNTDAPELADIVVFLCEDCFPLRKNEEGFHNSAS